MNKTMLMMILLVLLYTTGKSQHQVSLAEAKTAAINTMRYNRQMYLEDDINTVNTYESNGNTLIYEVKFNNNIGDGMGCIIVIG